MITITLPQDLEQVVSEQAAQEGISVEELVFASLRRVICDKEISQDGEYLSQEEIRNIMTRANAQTGFTPNQAATPAKAREYMRSIGIKAEDNLFSRGIIAAREEK